MIRIIIQDCDFGAAANIGGPVESHVKSFDVDIPALEKHLRDFKEMSDKCKSAKQMVWSSQNVAGIELL